MLGGRLKMGLELLLLPQGISHWWAGSGTSCSHCHQETGHELSPFIYTCLSGRNSGKAFVHRNKWIVQRRACHTSYPLLKLCGAQFVLLLFWIIKEVINKVQRRWLWHFMFCALHLLIFELASSLLCFHGDPRQGMGARWKLGLVAGGDTGHVSSLSSHRWKKALQTPQQWRSNRQQRVRSSSSKTIASKVKRKSQWKYIRGNISVFSNFVSRL